MKHMLFARPATGVVRAAGLVVRAFASRVPLLVGLVLIAVAGNAAMAHADAEPGAHVYTDDSDHERSELLAMGFDPDDPVILAIYREERQALGSPKALAAAGDFFVRKEWGTNGHAFDSYFRDLVGLKAVSPLNGNVITLGRGRKGLAGGDMQFVLTKRDKNGVRLKWDDVPNAFADVNKEYIVYPNNGTGLSALRGVHDIKVHNNRIYVLATAHFSGNTWVPLVRCFTLTGADCGWRSRVFSLSPTDPVQDAVAFDIYGDQMVILARYSLGESGGFRVVRWGINPDGSLSEGTTMEFLTPGGSSRTEPVDIAAKRRPLLTTGAGLYSGFYVAYTRKWSGDANNKDYDPCLLSVKADDTPSSDLAGGSSLCRPFDELESSREDRAISLKTTSWGDWPWGWQSSVEVLVSVARKRSDGIGVWRILNGENDLNFGQIGGPAGNHARGLGRVVVGGCGPLTTGGELVGDGCPSLPLLGAVTHTPKALAYMGNELALVGHTRWSSIVSPLFVRLDGSSGKREQITSFRHPDSDSDQRFFGMAVSDRRNVIAIGEDVQVLNQPFFVSTMQRLTALTSELPKAIFKDGFE